MRTVADLLRGFDRLAPFDKAGGWDPVGLQLGDPAAECASVAVCHEVTAPVVEAVIDAGADTLISYHPLLFRPTTQLVAGAGPAGRAYRLVRHGIALGVVHTAFDVAPGGVADALADALGLNDVEPFGPNWSADSVKIATFVSAEHVEAVADAMAAAGGGTIGAYSGCSYRVEGMGAFFAGPGTDPATGSGGTANREPETRIEMIAPASRRDAVVAALVAAHPYEEPAYDVFEVASNAGFIGRRGILPAATRLGDFATAIAERLESTPRVAGDRNRELERLAVIPGSGRSFIGAVGAVDAVVTGDVGHHDARALLERGIAVVDPGHAATERPGVARLYAAVAQLAGGAIDLTGIDQDPWA